MTVQPGAAVTLSATDGASTAQPSCNIGPGVSPAYSTFAGGSQHPTQQPPVPNSGYFNPGQSHHPGATATYGPNGAAAAQSYGPSPHLPPTSNVGSGFNGPPAHLQANPFSQPTASSGASVYFQNPQINGSANSAPAPAQYSTTTSQLAPSALPYQYFTQPANQLGSVVTWGGVGPSTTPVQEQVPPGLVIGPSRIPPGLASHVFQTTSRNTNQTTTNVPNLRDALSAGPGAQANNRRGEFRPRTTQGKKAALDQATKPRTVYLLPDPGLIRLDKHAKHACLAANLAPLLTIPRSATSEQLDQLVRISFPKVNFNAVGYE